MKTNIDNDYLSAIQKELLAGEGTISSPYKLNKFGILVVFLGGIGLTISLIYLFARNILSIFNKS